MKTKLLFNIVLFLIPLIVSGQSSSDSCADAELATHITAPGTFSVTSFDGVAPDPSCAGISIADHGEWFAYTPSGDFRVVVSSDLVENAGIDTRLSVYTGSCGSLQCFVGSDDDGSISSTLSAVQFNALAGETYYIAWDDKYDSRGFNFELVESDLLPVSFTAQGISTGGSIRGVVDMNNDQLDDIVSVVSRTVSTEPLIQEYDINIQTQIPSGGFIDTDHTISAPYSASWSLAAGDYNGDGYNDLVWGNGTGVNIIKAENSGSSYSLLLSRQGVFTQRTNFVDINRDGNLDVFICHDVAPNVYYLNDGSDNLIYFQGADVNGVPEGLGTFSSGGHYGSVWIDYNNDGKIDMFMAKCGGGEARKTNQLFKNNGNSSFTEVGAVVGLADPIQTWSGAWGDFDNDGDMDVFIGGYNGASHKLMRNNYDGSDPDSATFTDVTATSGLGLFSYTGIDNVPGDFNNDGFIDIFSNGNMLINDGNTNTISFSAYTSGMPSHGAVGDLNNDGFLDISSGGSISFNDTNSNNYLKVNLTDNSKTKGGIGARIEITSPLGTQIRDVRSGEGFRYMSSLTTHFGLGEDTMVGTLKILWPSGTVDILNNLSVNQTIDVTEGQSLSSQNQEYIDDLVIYPTPAKKELYIRTKYDLSDANYTVFDISGKTVLNSKLPSNKAINVSSLSTGTYFLRIMNDNASRIEKFIKE